MSGAVQNIYLYLLGYLLLETKLNQESISKHCVHIIGAEGWGGERESMVSLGL